MKENNYNDQAIEMRSGCIIHNNMPIFINKKTPVFCPSRIFRLLLFL